MERIDALDLIRQAVREADGMTEGTDAQVIHLLTTMAPALVALSNSVRR